MHLSALAKYAVKLTYVQAGVQTASNAGERVVAPTAALIMAGFGLGLSSFSMKKMACTPSRRSSLLRML